MFLSKKQNLILFALFFSANFVIQAKESIPKPKFLLTRADQTKDKTPEKENLKDAEKDIYQWLRTVSEVVTLVEQKAFRDVDFSSFIQKSMQAAVPSIDSHSAFFTAEEVKKTNEKTSGEFGGLGVSVISKATADDALLIIGVTETGPAQKAGIKTHDKIIEIDGKKLRDLDSEKVIEEMLKGKVGTTVKLTVIRENKDDPKDRKILEFKIKREIIKDQTSLCYFFKDQNIYYLSLRLFTQTASNQIEELIKKANDGACKGIILDLRRNPGGILDSVVEMSGLFIDKKSLVVSTKDRSGKTLSKYYTNTDPILKSDIPIFILIDNFTASASEILAGTLKYYSDKASEESGKKQRNLMVFLAGTPTFGKGSVQEVIPIGNGCALKLTTMLYYLPNQESIQAVGIKPDFIIKPKTIPEQELKLVKEFYGKESSLKNHITPKETGKEEKKEEKDKSKKETEKSWDEKQKAAINQDVQIKGCVNLINLLDIAKKCSPKLVETRQKALKFLKQNYLTDQEVPLEKVK